MRLAAGILVLLLSTGCGGLVVLESRTDAPGPRTVPAQHYQELTARQAVAIAMQAASERHCGHLDVEDVKSDDNRWRVELRGQCGCCSHAVIRVKVDRHSGEIVSYKVKRHKHDHKRGQQGDHCDDVH
jgi:hypothetical protein